MHCLQKEGLKSSNFFTELFLADLCDKLIFFLQGCIFFIYKLRHGTKFHQSLFLFEGKKLVF